jgi:hypothetical protein
MKLPVLIVKQKYCKNVKFHIIHYEVLYVELFTCLLMIVYFS